MTIEAHLKRTPRTQSNESSSRERHEVAAVEIGLNAAILAVRNDEPVVLVVRPSGLLQALIGVFETLWTLGIPVTDIGGEQGLPERDRAILTLMAAGATDEAIARRLDMSRRTVVRRIASLLDKLGATTRFQAGVQAAKRGLL